MDSAYKVDALVPAATPQEVAAWEAKAKIAVWLAEEPVWRDSPRLADLVNDGDPEAQHAVRVGREFLWRDGYGQFFDNDGNRVFPRRNDGTD